MLSPMSRSSARFAPFLLVPWMLCGATAQQTLAEVEQKFRAEMQQLAANSPSAEQRQQLFARQATALRAFLTDTAKGDDRWNGRLMLADLEMMRGEPQAAIAALRGLDAAAAPALVLVTAATMAGHLRMAKERDAWIAAAIAKPAPLEDRLAMARLLMNAMHDVARGEKLFGDALLAATDDEQRAYVRWFRADALREREDLPDNAAFDELEKLAKDLPDTYWGGVAKDRHRATQLSIGDPAIEFHATTLAGEPASLAAQRGKVVVLAFWTQADYDTPGLVALLEQQVRAHPDTVCVYGICLDRQPDEIKKAVRELGIDFPVIGDGKGPLGDAALRWFVEGPVVQVVDRGGRIAALGLQTGTADGKQQLTDVIEHALRD